MRSDFVYLFYGRTRSVVSLSLLLLSLRHAKFLAENIALLGDDTKVISADGSFKTSPALRDGHLYQILGRDSMAHKSTPRIF